MPSSVYDFTDRIAKGIPPPVGAAPAGGRVQFDFTTAFPGPRFFPG